MRDSASPIAAASALQWVSCMKWCTAGARVLLSFPAFHLGPDYIYHTLCCSRFSWAESCRELNSRFLKQGKKSTVLEIGIVRKPGSGGGVWEACSWQSSLQSWGVTKQDCWDQWVSGTEKKERCFWPEDFLWSCPWQVPAAKGKSCWNSPIGSDVAGYLNATFTSRGQVQKVCPREQC